MLFCSTQIKINLGVFGKWTCRPQLLFPFRVTLENSKRKYSKRNPNHCVLQQNCNCALSGWSAAWSRRPTRVCALLRQARPNGRLQWFDNTRVAWHRAKYATLNEYIVARRRKDAPVSNLSVYASLDERIVTSASSHPSCARFEFDKAEDKITNYYYLCTQGRAGVFREWQSGQTNILVATDLGSRGLDTVRVC